MISDEVKAEREAVLLAHLKGESDKDVEAVLATMPQPTYDLVTVGRAVHMLRARHKGIDQRRRNVIKDGLREPCAEATS
jgi:hypothetical protein